LQHLNRTTMFSHRTLSFTSRPRRRLFAGLALLAYTMCLVGYPVHRTGSQDRSTPFPCQDHACGCNSAAQCWDNCCCFSPAERLAWAREHGVRIPTAVATRLAEEAAEATEHLHAAKSCCRETHDAHAAADTPCGSCSQETACDAHSADAAADHHESTGGIRWINAIAAQKCQGLTTLWLLTGASLPVEIKSLWEFDWTPAGSAVVASANSISHAWAPPVPPPRG
jgi:hypothetical protein